MAVAFDAASSGNGTGSSVTVSHTCSGADRVLIVDAAISNSGRTLTATYNGVSMTSLGLRHSNDASSGYIEKFILIAPATGANNIVVTRSGGGNPTLIVGGVSFTGASQTLADYTGHFFSAAGQGTAPSVAVTGTVSDSIVADGVCNGSAINAVGADQTERWQLDVDASSAAGNAGASTEPGNGGTVTMSWTVTSDWYAIQAVEILAAGGGPENVDLATAALTFAPQALDPVPGVTNVDLSTSTLTFAPQALSPVSGVVNLDLATGTLTFTPQALSPVSGVVNLDLAPGLLILAPQALDPQELAGGLAVDLAPAILTLTPQALDPVSGVVNLDLVPALLIFGP